LAEWVSKHALDIGLTLQPQTAHLLAEYIGNDLQRIANEIDKLRINLKPGENITPEMVQRFIGISKEYNIFELQKALVQNDALKAHRIVNYFGSDPKGNSIQQNIGALFSFFQKVLMVHGSGDKSEAGLSAALKLPVYFMKDYIQASKRFNIGKTVEIIHLLREADLQTKGVTGRDIPDGEVMKELVFKMMH
jgi:DNA polymerase-3 subunit delta